MRADSLDGAFFQCEPFDYFETNNMTVDLPVDIGIFVIMTSMQPSQQSLFIMPSSLKAIWMMQ